MALLRPAIQVDDQRADELTKLGVAADTALAWLAEQEAEDEEAEAQAAGSLVIWPENWPVLRLFLALQTQWRYKPCGQLQGLRYDAAEVLMRRGGFKKKRRLFAHLQQMETAALEAWDEQQQQH